MAAFLTPIAVLSFLVLIIPVAALPVRLTFVTVLAQALKEKSPGGAASYSRTTGLVGAVIMTPLPRAMKAAAPAEGLADG